MLALCAYHFGILGIECKRHGLILVLLENDLADNLNLRGIAKSNAVIVAHEFVALAFLLLIVGQLLALRIHFFIPAENKETLLILREKLGVGVGDSQVRAAVRARVIGEDEGEGESPLPLLDVDPISLVDFVERSKILSSSIRGGSTLINSGGGNGRLLNVAQTEPQLAIWSSECHCHIIIIAIEVKLLSERAMQI